MAVAIGTQLQDKLTELRRQVGNGHPARAAFAAAFAASLVVVASGIVLLFVLSNSHVHTTLQFAGSNARLEERLSSSDWSFTLSQVRWAQLWGAIFAVIWGTVGYLLFVIFWRHCWKAGAAASLSAERKMRYLPIIGASTAIVEHVVAAIAVRGDGSDIGFVWKSGFLLVTLSSVKWVLATATVLAVTGMLVAAATGSFQRVLDTGEEVRKELSDDSRLKRTLKLMSALSGTAFGLFLGRPAAVEATRQEPPEEANVEHVPIPDRGEAVGICCSGGGIRSASFALGALSALERYPNEGPLSQSVIGNADYLASVSGGGYAASAWRTAAGTNTTLPSEPMLGDPNNLVTEPNKYPDSNNPAPNVIEHIRERRWYLANGMGGIPAAVLVFVAQTVWHLILLIAAVFMIFWPFGLLLKTWQIDALAAQDGEIVFQLDSHQWAPIAVLASFTALLCLGRLFLPRRKVRGAWDAAIAGAAVLTAVVSVPLVVLPFMVELTANATPESVTASLTFTGIWAVVMTAVWQASKRYLKRSGKFLGGVLLVAGLLFFGLFVVEQGALGQGVLSYWISPIVVYAGLLVAFVFFDPDSWSLHGFYRRSLTGTFAVEYDVDNHRACELEPSKIPFMSEYAHTKPSPIVCCSAARKDTAHTGVAALSMTFEPNQVSVYRWRRSSTSQSYEQVAQSISHEDFVARLPRRKRRSLGTIIGVAAVSGAAVAPSLGRMNLKTTNALLAAFNARLGVWVPNPGYPPPPDTREGETEEDAVILKRKSSPRLVNMFKEIAGVYDQKDPNVYATDGGHWENIGIVELVRRGCRSIIAIDASGDPPGAYTALKEAIALAHHECDARIEFPEDEWAYLEPAEDGIVARNYMLGSIKYHDGEKGSILFIKAAVARDTPIETQRYSASDRTFPHYSTGNQLLSDLQMVHLVKLGFAATQEALERHYESLNWIETQDLRASDVPADAVV